MPTAKELRAGNFYGTKSNIPKSPRQKKMWERANEIVMKEVGTTNEKKVPYGLVTTIYKNALSVNKIPKRADIKDTRYSKTVSKYKNQTNREKKSDSL